MTWDVMTCVSPGCRLWGISSPPPCGQFVTCNHINRSQNVVKSDHCTQASDVRTKISDFSSLRAALFISSLYLFVAGGNQIPPPGAAAAKYCLICPNLGPGIVSMSRSRHPGDHFTSDTDVICSRPKFCLYNFHPNWTELSASKLRELSQPGPA